MFGIGISLLLLLESYAQAQDPNCDFVKHIKTGMPTVIFSPNYPYNYTAGVYCRWIAVCQEGYNCKVNCWDVNLPESPSCSLDRLLISKTGDSQFNSSNYYCGRRPVSAVSTGTRISLALITSTYSSGGRLACDVSAQPAGTPTCTCGYHKTNRTIRGEETQPNEYPMMAGIVYVGDNNIKCGAVIIGNSYVLTAAHCVANRTINNIAVVVGEHDVTRGVDIQVLKVAAIKIHRQFNPNTLANDIAIIMLNGTIKYSDNVGPVCLPFKFANRDFVGASVTILGWNSTTSRVKKQNVEVISQTSCSRSVSGLTSRQMCTITQSKDTCQDSSGGPLLYRDPSNGRLYNVGVVSFGRFCESNSNPGVNTRITAFLDWIVINAPANYCII